MRFYSDSAYLINCMNDGWHLKWQQNGWRNSAKKPVKNTDLWRELLRVAEPHTVKWIKVKGHSGVAANEPCHNLVGLALDKRLWG